MKWVFSFSEPLPEDAGDVKMVLGGKGASLREMTSAGLQVPPGFTIRSEACQAYFERERRWPDGLEEQVRAALARLEAETGRTFGRGPRPLLVSVRSGAAVSMPGMMDTLLNCGLHPRLAADLGNPAWFWPCYAQFIAGYARIVDGIKDLMTATTVGCVKRSADAPSPAGDVTGATGASALRLTHPADEADVRRLLDEYASRTGHAFPTEPWALLAACINAVFASWHSERAVAYRQRHDVRGVLGTAVNVQAMWPSEVSGICFTQDPTAPAANRIVVEASYGLGEAVVSGEVTPDRFLMPRDRPDDIEAHLGHKTTQVAAFGAAQAHDPDAACLTRSQLRDLFDLALNAERHFGHPLDLEWGWADDRFVLLQARAIRGLDAVQASEETRQAEIARLRQLANGTKKVWVIHNLGETLRAPTPLTWDIIRHFMSGGGGFGRLYRDLGYQPSRRVSADGFLELIAGRIYADPDRLAELFWEGMPLTYDLDALAEDRSLLDRAPTKFDAAKADGWFLLRLPRTMWSMWSASRRIKEARRDAAGRFEKTVLPPYLEYVQRERERDLTKLGDDELLRELDDRRRKVLDEFGPESLKPGFFAGTAFDALEHLLQELGGAQEGAALAGTLTLALEGDVTFEQDRRLYDIAHGKATLPTFLERFGHRTIGEMELAVPRWREQPAYLGQTIARLRAHPGRSPDDIHEQNRQRRAEAEEDLPRWLRLHGGGSLQEDVEAALREARALLPYRESGKFYLMMGYELIRLVIEELARRTDLGGAIYFLHRPELDQLVGQAFQTVELSRLRDEAAARRATWHALQRLELPPTITSDQLDGLGIAPPVVATDELVGAAMAPGVATGIARIVHDPADAPDLGADYVLVCSSTDPGWTPLFLNARGLVVERGGVLSHGAIVARDFGIPAVACPDATRQLHDGDTVRVDGNLGRVSVLSRSDSARSAAHA